MPLLVFFLMIRLFLGITTPIQHPDLQRESPSDELDSCVDILDGYYLRITFSERYEHPFYVSLFFDYYQEPWLANYLVTENGLEEGWHPNEKTHRFKGGESTNWIAIKTMIPAQKGARIIVRTFLDPSEPTPFFDGKIDFATRPDDRSIVKSFQRSANPAAIHIRILSNLKSDEALSEILMDQEEAFQRGKIADAFNWPRKGKKPVRFPFFVTTHLDTLLQIGAVAEDVAHRELTTLAYFGFNGSNHATREMREICGFSRNNITDYRFWSLKTNQSYLQPEIDRMKQVARALYEQSRTSTPGKIDYFLLMDEPHGPQVEELLTDPVAAEKFRKWLKSQNVDLPQLLTGVAQPHSWEMTKPVGVDEKSEYPALYYYTQKFRTYALGSFIEAQKKVLHETFQDDFPVLVNFSDGVLYYGNFYGQGVDYFELLETTNQNAIWSEDWANISSSYQCSSFNVDLMRAASRRKNAVLGSYLIAHADRKPWDVKLKAISAVARGVKILNNFYYGPTWGAREGGWNANPENWQANAEVIREIGDAEDLLLPAKTQKAEVAILYSSSSDIWNLNVNHAYGFNQMHTWMALTHAQIPVDIVSERDVEEDFLESYKVCYFSGTHLTSEAAVKLRQWVEKGGVLVLTAGACERDEFNQPLNEITEILPAQKEEIENLESHLEAGRHLSSLNAQDYVHVGGTSLEVLSVKQKFKVTGAVDIMGTFKDGSPAIVKGRVGEGAIYLYAFLPALSYIKDALVHRKKIESENSNNPIPAPHLPFSDAERIGRSYNPWHFSEPIRSLLVNPVLQAKVKLPLTCSVPLVDAVLMESDNGLVLPLANYTLQPIQSCTFSLKTTQSIARVKSVYHGDLNFYRDGSLLTFTVPLKETDIIQIFYE